MTRRDFAIRLASLGGLLAVMPSCFLSSNIYKNLEHYVPTALLAFDRIIEILVEHGIDVSHLVNQINQVKACLADIQTAILAWKSGRENQKPTLAEAVRTTLRLAASALDIFWGSLRLPPQLASTIKPLFDILVSTLMAFELIGANRGPGSKTFLGTEPKLRTIREFREEFNGVLSEHNESRFAI